jgi:hypothetical protein
MLEILAPLVWSAAAMKPTTAPSALKIRAMLGERFTVLEFDIMPATSERSASR